MEIAESIQTRIREELGMPCSIGIAPNKLLAKMASDLKKPNGISILRMRDVPRILWHRPCNEMFGIGKKTAEKLKKLGIETIGQLAKSDERMLTDVFGINGSWLKNSANGINHSAVQAEREANKSIGHTTTLPADISEPDDVHRVLLNISDQVARRLRKHEMLSQGIQITIRTPDMKTITRSRMMEVPTEDASIIYREACALFAKHWGGGKPVRMLGVTLQTLIPREESAIQLDLFEYEQKPKKENLIRIMDQLRDKFGENAVVTAGMLGDDPSVLLRNHKVRGTSLQKDNLQSLD